MVAPTSPFERFERYLRQNGGRMTPQRRLILLHIVGENARFKAEELIRYFHTHETPVRVARATIYRTLMELTDCGLLRHENIDGHSFYDIF